MNTFENQTIGEIASANNLEYIETTPNRTGYPESIRPAIIGFDTFEAAKELADKYDLSIEKFPKKDGWHLWVRSSHTVWEEFKNSVEDYGDNYSEYDPTSYEEEEDFISQEVKPALEVQEDFETLEAVLSDYKEIWEEINNCEDGQVVIAHEGRYHEKLQKQSMYFYHDTNHYVIGLIKN